jgi:ribosomal-protein-alanine acetyltransferase
MTYLLSRAVLEDLPAMISWEGALFGTDAWSPEVMVAELSHPASYYLVARPDGDDAIVGYAGLRAGNRGGDGDIQTVAVAPEHRGKGLGRLLVEALLSEARERLVSAVFLEVRADNDAARGLYASLGFQEIDRRTGYYQPDGVDALVMTLVLGTPEPGWAVGND